MYRAIFLIISILLLSNKVFSQVEIPVRDDMSHYFQLKYLQVKDSIFDESIRPYYTSFFGDTSSRQKFILYPAIGSFVNFSKGSYPVFSNYFGGIGLYRNKRFTGWVLPYFYYSQSEIYHCVKPEYVRGFYSRYNYNENSLYFADVMWEAEFNASQFLKFYAGKGKLFLGEGINSLWISGSGAPYNYFRGIVDVWHIKYVWQIGSGYDKDSLYYGLNTRRRKYFALHYLDWEATNWLNVQLFETVIWAQYSDKYKRGLELAYMNPIIFYRPVEFDIGSADNVIMGGGLVLRPFKRLFLYSQLLLDEFKISEIRAKKGWWGNKFGLQGGVKYYLPKAYFIVEANAVRPFTYSHNYPISNYGMDRQPLAHPEGANFVEFLFDFRYKFKKDVYLSLYGGVLKKGLNTDSINYGSDIYWSYDYLRQEYGNRLLSGDLFSKYYVGIGGGKFVGNVLELYGRAGFRQVALNNELNRGFYFEAGIRSIFF
jgi:hypothetical protein